MSTNSTEAGTDSTVVTPKPFQSAFFREAHEESLLLLEKMRLRRERAQAMEEEYLEAQKQEAQKRGPQPCIRTLQGGSKPLSAIKVIQLLEKMKGKR